MVAAAPDLAYEYELCSHGLRLIAGVDEVGRGSLAGPVSVGLVVIDGTNASPLAGVKDSKLLKESVRNELVPQIKEWALASAVGHASAAEIDQHGLVVALRLAGTRALEQISEEFTPELVILDGNQDWLSVPVQSELDIFADLDGAGSFDSEEVLGAKMPVKTRIKADMTCLSVAAASVLAKVERDAIMKKLAQSHPEFGWEINKGYATPAHRAAIAASGPSDFHRKTWRLS